MPFALILPPALAIWIILGDRRKILQTWHLNQLSAVALILAAVFLSYFDLLFGEYYFNLGGIFLLLFSLWLLWQLPLKGKLRSIGAALLIGALVFISKSGLLWQIDQYTSYSQLAVIIVSVILSAATGEYRAALTAAALGVEGAGLAWTLICNGEMGLPFLNLLVLITAGAWLIIRLIEYFKRRQLTNSAE